MSTVVSPATVSWLLPIATALITAVATGFAVWATNSASHKRMVTQLAADTQNERRTRRRERIEELYLVFDRWASAMKNHHARFKLVTKGQLEYEALWGEQWAEAIRDIDMERIYMIADIYFPDGHNELGMVMDFHSTFVDIQNDFALKFEKNEIWSDDDARQLDEVLIEFRQFCNDYLSALATHARELD